ncbi:MAG: GGDEF domain-containing protein [Candidatus Brocadiae bacterium]|nr:GGDEF domain-containing protein [Candidatus Brocadiia bacterium]
MEPSVATSVTIPRIRLRLMFLSVIAMSPLFALTLATGLEERNQALNDDKQEVRRLARVVSDDLVRLMEGPRQLLSIMPAIPVVQEGDPAECGRFFASLVRDHPQYANIGLISPEGRMVACAAPSGEPEDFSQRTYFRKARDERSFAVGEYHLGPVSRRPSLGFALPITDAAGRLRFVAFASLDLTWISGLALAVELPPGSTVTLWDDRGIVLLRHPDPEDWIGRSGAGSEVHNAILASSGEGSVEARGLDGVNRLYAFRRLIGRSGDSEVALAIGVPSDVAYADARKLERRNLIILVGATIVAAGLAAAFGERVVLRLYSRLFDLANTDALTRIHSRRRFLALAEAECARAHRFQHPLALLMLDVDHFKAVNDTRGHGAGDDALVEIAARLRALLRDVDVLGRYGGEEFVVLLPESGGEAALEVAERLREAISARPIQTRAGAVPVTISAGVATLGARTSTPEALLAEADRALYSAKERGRNCVVEAR